MLETNKYFEKKKDLCTEEMTTFAEVCYVSNWSQLCWAKELKSRPFIETAIQRLAAMKGLKSQ